MMRTLKILLSLLALVTGLCQCKQSYVSPYASPPTGYLVVEGYITGNGPTSFTLSRTIPLPGDSAIPVVTGAQLQVEGSDNSVYPLTEKGNGVYGIDTLALSTTVKYRLRIGTPNGEKYLSDFGAYKITPAIDSISWTADGTGVNIYANTHDPANATRYYQWQYVETWEYHSAEQSSLEYRGDTTPVMVVPRPPQDQIFRCWRTTASTSLLLGTSAKLANDVIYLQLLNLIPTGDQRISVLYSILVSQYALTDSAYNFLTLMQKNTESLGSIFDAQPSQLVGNIHCLTNPTEPVIGYVSAGTLQQQRLYISRSQVPAWPYFYSCPIPDTLVARQTDSLKKYFGSLGFDPIDIDPMTQEWLGNLISCVDCRSQGGTNVAPSFWPN
jgi:hypothetical protein